MKTNRYFDYSPLKRRGQILVAIATIISIATICIEWSGIERYRSSSTNRDIDVDDYLLSTTSSLTEVPSGRVAVCLTGSPRGTPASKISLNTSEWPLDAYKIFVTMNSSMQKEFLRYVENEMPTVTDTIHKFAYPSFGQFEVFMYYVVEANDNESVWEPYTPRSPGNKLIFQSARNYQPTLRDMNTTKKLYDRANKFYSPNGLLYQFVNMLWGMIKCSQMIIKHEQANNFTYDVVVRLRADSVFFAPISKNLSSVGDAGCEIFMRPLKNGCCGNEDIFNFGPRDVMLKYLRRLKDFTSTINRLGNNVFWSEKYVKEWFNSVCGRSELNEEIDTIFTHPWRRK